MKTVSLTALVILIVADFTTARVITKETNVTETKTVKEEIIEDKPVDFSTESQGQPLLGGVQLNLGDRLELSGLTTDVGDLGQIVLRQLGGTLTIGLRLVDGLVFEVVDILVATLVNTLLPGVETTLSLVDTTGRYVALDVSNTRTLLLKTVSNARRQPVTLVLTLN
ncbi:hypothetical protein M8J75_010093 [Diaphorina citri]|nr:hypothetical protein M8J75_010093 [Diaphorina citri]KAI5747154.1 hypothetical protein M8J77_011670 [Diaphorina citri]